MASLNADSNFKQKKRTTIPTVKLPKNVKSALMVDSAAENGIFKIEPGKGMAVYDQCYIFEDINYFNQDEDRKESILLQLMAWLKAMPYQFKITVANEQTSMEDVMAAAFKPVHGRDYPEAKAGIGQWINQKVAEGVRDINKVMYLTVTCRAKSYEEAAMHFATLDATLSRIFAMLSSRLYKLSGLERLCVLQSILKPDGIRPKKAPKKTDQDWKNSVMPVSIRSDKNYMEVDRHFVSVLFGFDDETTLDDEKVLYELINVPYPVTVTLDMEPVSRRILMEKLSGSLMNNDRAIAAERDRNIGLGQYGAGTSYRLEKRDDELKELLDQVQDNDEQSLFVGLLVIVQADTLHELESRVDTLMSTARLNGYALETYNYRQLKALNTALPIGGRQVNHMRNFLTSSAVAFNPFHARDIRMAGGHVYGLNRTTRHLLQINRKKLASPHCIILGHTGSGKSVIVKLADVLQTLLFSDDDIIILDPQNEYEFVVNACGGQYFDFTPKSKIHLNPFEVPENVRNGTSSVKEKFIAGKTAYACAFMEAVMFNIVFTQVHNTLIDRAVRRTYAEYFEGKKKTMPTLTAIRENLKAQMGTSDYAGEERMLRDMLLSIEQYVDGVYDMFAHPSNLDIRSRLVGFGLKNVPESIWEPVMVTMMHYLSERVDKNQDTLNATLLIVDEAQVICARPSSAEQLLETVETCRKFGGMVTLIIQNLTRAIENDKLRDMFSNCKLKIFLDQGGVDAASFASIQQLSEAERKALNEKNTGHGILVCNDEVYMFDAKMDSDNPIYEMISTNFHEKAEKEKNVRADAARAKPLDTGDGQ